MKKLNIRVCLAITADCFGGILENTTNQSEIFTTYTPYVSEFLPSQASSLNILVVCATDKLEVIQFHFLHPCRSKTSKSSQSLGAGDYVADS